MAIEVKRDSRILITWVAVLAVVIYAFVAHEITWQIMIGYFATIGIPSLFQQRRDAAMQERQSDRQPTEVPVTSVAIEPAAPKGSVDR